MHAALPAGLCAALPWGLRPTLLDYLVFGGCAILTVSLIVLMCTRWGQSRPLAKCAALSLNAHFLLLMYAYGTHVFFGPPASQYGTTINVGARVRFEQDVEEAAVADAPQEPVSIPSEDPPQVAESPAPPPLLPAKPRTVEPEEVSPVAEPKPAEEPPQVAANDPPPEPPPPVAPPQPPAETPVNATGRHVRAGDGLPVPEALANRATDQRAALLDKYGGNPDTERAVQNALDWLVKNQNTDGRWQAAKFGAGKETRTLGHDRGGAGAKADTGITGLAILALQGAGETHLEGARRESVQHGLEFLLASQATDGNLAGQAELFAAMYCHSIALLAVTEAYALTGDARLKPYVERGVNFSLRAQHPDGGWRYRPLDAGDMSQFGWQVMAMRSAKLGGIDVPDEAFRRMGVFLEKCSTGPARGLGAYRPGDRATRPMTAEALACRYFLHTANSADALTEASAFVREELPGPRANFYYWYYGTVAMFQRGGNDWKEWNAALQAALLDTQRVDGDLVGTWDPDPLWGGYGGRVFSTSLGALCLESYYRYLPLMLTDEERELRLTNRPGDGPKRQ